MPREIALDKITASDDVQARVRLSESVIADYGALMLDGTEFPPLTVFEENNGTLWLADGFHRLEAAKRTGKIKTFLCDVREGSKRDAILYACGANRMHGQRPTKADQRKAVGKLLLDPEWRRWSDNQIGKICGVSHPTVGTIRKSLAAASGEADDGTRRYRTKHGTETTMRTKKKSTAKQKPEQKPEPADEDDAAATKPVTTPETLPKTARQKVEAAIRQEKKRLQVEFNQAVDNAIEQERAEFRRALDETVLPHYNKTLDDARRVLDRHKGVLTAAEFRLLEKCVHPDSVPSKEVRHDAFILLQDRERVLVPAKIEKDAKAPTRPAPPPFPRTREELMAGWRLKRPPPPPPRARSAGGLAAPDDATPTEHATGAMTLDQHFEAIVDLLKDEPSRAVESAFHKLRRQVQDTWNKRRRQGTETRPLTAMEQTLAGTEREMNAALASAFKGPAKTAKPKKTTKTPKRTKQVSDEAKAIEAEQQAKAGLAWADRGAGNLSGWHRFEAETATGKYCLVALDSLSLSSGSSQSFYEVRHFPNDGVEERVAKLLKANPRDSYYEGLIRQGKPVPDPGVTLKQVRTLEQAKAVAERHHAEHLAALEGATP